MDFKIKNVHPFETKHKIKTHDTEHSFQYNWQMAEFLGIIASDKKSIQIRCKKMGYTCTFAK